MVVSLFIVIGINRCHSLTEPATVRMVDTADRAGLGTMTFALMVGMSFVKKCRSTLPRSAYLFDSYNVQIFQILRFN